MKSYDVKVEWSGYSRGIATYRIDAESEEEAKELFIEGELRDRVTMRDDTEVQDVIKIEEVDF